MLPLNPAFGFPCSSERLNAPNHAALLAKVNWLKPHLMLPSMSPEHIHEAIKLSARDTTWCHTTDLWYEGRSKSKVDIEKFFERAIKDRARLDQHASNEDLPGSAHVVKVQQKQTNMP
ncbi:hypothetical protein CVT25_009174 [Psilocybe cyanescens]|uniref:Uncharacterized protein n=1 Tax=Psilocybe cyanescens TaxID=93625 RepID=A0A409VRW9_PSICY|nr:hypothetical protein CVT25_009174 [Psilocybe cyanescens]